LSAMAHVTKKGALLTDVLWEYELLPGILGH
jgi:hypothetical protein